MGKFIVELKGFKELQGQLKNISKELKSEIEFEISETALQVVELAVKDAPADTGGLRRGITASKTGEMQWTVFSNALQSAYIEFGTKSKAVIPTGLREEVVIEKSSLSAKQAIFAWCKRKGIEQKFWYPIYIKILTEGISPHPFFFKQQEIVGPKLLTKIQSVLNEQRL